MLQHFQLSMELNELLSRSEYEAAFSSALQVYIYIFREREREKHIVRYMYVCIDR